MILLAILLPACGGQDARSTPEYFIPPTLSHIPTPTPIRTPTPVAPTPTLACENGLTFIDDVTVEDNSVFAPGDTIEKTWLVKNSGTCNWDEDYTIRFVEGVVMGAEKRQGLFPARAGSEVEITITFTAPRAAGVTFSSWQAYTPDDEPFGDRIFIQIVVDPDLKPTATP